MKIYKKKLFLLSGLFFLWVGTIELFAQSGPPVECSATFETKEPTYQLANWRWWSKDTADWIWYRRMPNNIDNVRLQLYSPFHFKEMSGGLENANVAHFYQNPDKISYLPEEGWEVVMKKFGRDTIYNGVYLPIFVLYNRFSGLTRVFIYHTFKSPLPVKNVILSIEFYNLIKQSALLSLINPDINALDSYQKNVRYKFENQYDNDAPGNWLFYEFTSVYDPCTCDWSYNINIEGWDNVGELTDNRSILQTRCYLTVLENGREMTPQIEGFDIHNPGSVSATEQTAYWPLQPTYNNTLGIFNLIETPKLEYVAYRPENLAYERQYPSSTQTGVDFGNRPKGSPYIRQYRLKEPIKYAFNPAAGLEIVSLEAAWVQELPQNIPSVSAASFEPQTKDGNKTDQRYAFIGPVLAAPFGTSGNRLADLQNAGVTVDTSRLEKAIETIDDARQIRTMTPFTPLSCFSDNNFMYGVFNGTNTAPLDTEPNIYLKIKATLRRKDAAPGMKDIIYTQTFRTQAEAHSSAFEPSNTYRFAFVSPYSSSDVPYYVKENRAGVHYGKDYYIDPNGFRSALNPSGLAFNAGYFGISPSELPNVLPPSFGDCAARPLPAAVTPADISAFCQSRKYKATERRSKTPSPEVGLTVYPNPLSDVSQIEVNLPADTEVRLVLRDVTGRVVATVWAPGTVAAGRYTLPLDATTLSSGIYALTLETKQAHKTFKISIIK